MLSKCCVDAVGGPPGQQVAFLEDFSSHWLYQFTALADGHFEGVLDQGFSCL